MGAFEKNCLVSFVVPVYRTPLTQVEALLKTFSSARERCPSFPFEVLVIEDGSHVEGLSDLCQRLGAFYSWQENGGPASARKTGMARACGKYLSFVDSDDALEEGFLEILQEALKKEDDILVFPYFLEGSDRTVAIRPSEHALHEIMLSLFFASYRGLSSYGGEEGWYGYLWRYLYRREFLLEHRIQFDRSLTSGEDNCFLIDVFLARPSFSFSKRGYYHYCFNTDSISRKKVSPKTIWNRDRLLIEQLEERGRKAVEAGLLSPKELRQALYCRISTFAYVTLQNIIGQRLPYREGKEALKAYRDRARAHRVRLNGNIKRGKRIFAFLLTSFGPYFCYLLMKGATR